LPELKFRPMRESAFLILDSRLPELKFRPTSERSGDCVQQAVRRPELQFGRSWRALLPAVIAVVAVVWLRTGPLPPDLLAPLADRSTVVVDRHGEVLYEARSSAGTRGMTLSADEVPSALAEATTAAEDRRFYLHPGVDPIAIGRATLKNLRAHRVVEGASTITQQVAKLLLNRAAKSPRPRGLRAKLHEALIALRLEHHLAKSEILALYLNVAPYGNQVAGAARASEMYFGVPASMLTVAQAAFLAGLPQRPTAYSPYRDREPGLARQRAILDRLERYNRITGEQARAARSERLRFEPAPAAFVAPHFVEMVLSERQSRAARRIETTLDARLQADVAGILRSQRSDLDRHGAQNVSVVVLENATGEWLAWEGSGDYFDAEHGGTINGARALRQPGSALKPFTYALGFETGETPATVLADVPATYPTATQGVLYSPRNYDGEFHGPLRVRQALAGSQNVPAVALAARVGVPDVLRFLKSVGITTLDKNAAHYGLGLTLGNAEVTLADLVGAYAALARGGTWIQPRAVRDGSIPVQRRVMSARSAFWVTDVLADPEARAYVFGRGGSLEFPFPVAAKTGTSQAYHDNWAIGYTREVTVGVWVGNFDRRPLVGSSGVTGAGPIFHAVMLAAQHHVRGRVDSAADIVPRPPDLNAVEVCELSGMRSGGACPLRRREWLPPDTSPLPCSWHHQSDEGLLTLWPAEYRHWAAARGLLEEERRPSPQLKTTRALAVAAPQQGTPFEILSPADGTVYLIDPTLRPGFQAVALRATGAAGVIRWRVNGKTVGSVPAHRQLSWPLRRGEHEVSAVDARGRTARATIRVK
jgi:penicillin-binding protein 1C